MFLQLYSDQYNYSAPYKLFGYLTYDISEKGSEQDMVVASYKDVTKGFGNYSITDSVFNVLDAANSNSSGISDVYNVSINPEKLSLVSGGSYIAKKQNSSYLWFYYSDDGKECGSTQIDQTINNDCSDTPSESNITQEQLQTAAMSRSKEPASFTWRNLIRHHQSCVNNTLSNLLMG